MLFKVECEKALNLRIKSRIQKLELKRAEFDAIEIRLSLVEGKWISNMINHETYEKWFKELNAKNTA